MGVLNAKVDGVWVPIGNGSGTAVPSDAVINIQGVTGIWSGTQAAFDAITTKNPSVLYVIV